MTGGSARSEMSPAGIALAVLAALLSANVACAGDARPPGIVLIVLDDVGYADLGVHGSDAVRTPHLDAIAAAGVQFTNGYASAPICAPSRAGLLTGRYQQRFGYVNLTRSIGVQRAENRGVPTDEILLSQPLKQRGYVTGAIGKWHLGANEPFHPMSRGFDSFFGFLSGTHDYYDWGGADPIQRDRETVAGTTYLTDAFTDEAVAFIEPTRSSPFFLYLAYSAVHTPLQPPPSRGEPVRSVDPRRRQLIEMLHALDSGIGRVVAALRDANLEEDTLLVVVNDNGGARGSSNAPLRGRKGALSEGGIRVPFMLKWPGRIPAGQRYERPVIALDVFPTVAAAAGAELPGGRVIDGVDLLPFVTGDGRADPHEFLVWKSGGRGSYAVRRGDLKLVGNDDGASLYDLSGDAAESDDLSAQQPEAVAELREIFRAWNAEMVPPLF